MGEGNVQSQCGSYFSVCSRFIRPECRLPFDIYINSSEIKDRERFVKIFKKNDFITKEDIGIFIEKYVQLYVLESQRGDYSSHFSEWNRDGDVKVEALATLKNSAIKYLSDLFSEKRITTSIIKEHIEKCRFVVEDMLDIIKDKNVDDVRELIGRLSFHDFYTYDHSINVSLYCSILYRAICPEATREEVTTAAMCGLLHDIGKLKVPTEILNSSGPLSEENFGIIKKHPSYGRELLKGLKIDYKTGVDPLLVSRVAYEHHENFDGTGYPNKSARDDIHLLSRICAVADFFDAVTTKRSYQNTLSTTDALSLMVKYAGKRLDPMVLSVFLGLSNSFRSGNVPPMDVTKNFDPCREQVDGCFCKNENNGDELDYGDIVIMDQSLEEFKLWAKTPNSHVKFWKTKKKSQS